MIYHVYSEMTGCTVAHTREPGSRVTNEGDVHKRRDLSPNLQQDKRLTSLSSRNKTKYGGGGEEGKACWCPLYPSMRVVATSPFI